MSATTAVLFAVGALLVGFAKTSIGGIASIAVAIFASVMPARESTAAILLLLLTGDVVAVWRYRRHTDWALLRRLVPAVLPGLVLGAVFLAVVDDAVLRRSIGALLLLLSLLQLWLSQRPEPFRAARGGWFAPSTGLAAGFTTMTANAAGAVMTLYLVARGVDKHRYLGTNATFFLGVNLSKLPFSAGLGLFGPGTLTRTGVLAPLVLVGAWAGLRTASRLSQHHFDRAVLAATVLSSVALLVR